MPKFQLPYVAVQSVAAIADTDRLLLINRDPGPDETNVPLSWPIAIELVDTGPDGIESKETSVWVNDILAFDGEISPQYDGPDAKTSHSDDTLRVVLVPKAPFASQEKVAIRVVSTTSGGSATLDETYYFTAEDLTAPRATSAFATGQTTVVIGFDEPVLAGDIQGFAFQALDVPAVPVSAVSAVSKGSTIELQLDTEMTPGARYQLTISGVLDSNNNVIAPPYNTVVFLGFRPQQPRGRRFNLWVFLPRYNRRIDETGDLRRFIDCLQEVTDLLLHNVDRFGETFDIVRAPALFLDIILKDLGNPFEFDLSEIDKRRLASVLIEIYRQKGTAVGIRNVIRFFMGLEIEILPYSADVMRLGESKLGIDWILGADDRFVRYAFNVKVDRVLTDNQEKQLRSIVTYMKPAHTHFVRLEIPEPHTTHTNWILGRSSLGKPTHLN